ncbi:hypothetical protein GWN26_01965 [Candidatus Saccharibacteria bacterium]|nr:hypothetical protein [Calditrichia bacterium]NIV71442.1 hypothetical protein [Calditrichia bacterium]NIV97971.1 hypothetical protein [Candidatus Saccharibacteria bacterium]NIW78268.1 hypothetical protein [Calditrichia bacterium]
MNTAKLTSPTGLGIRNDPAGSGNYGAPRGKRRHNGIDFLCTPGQTVRCPVALGRVIREARPYAHDFKYSGLVIQGKHLAIKIFYLDPWPGIIGTVVKRGDPIGIAQDIREKYNGSMEAHIHLAIFSFNPELILQKEI